MRYSVAGSAMLEYGVLAIAVALGLPPPEHLTAALFEDEKVDTIECESAEAALAVMLIGGREVAMIFADVRLPGAMGGIDLAWEVKLRWPLLPMILTSGHPLERIRELPPGVAYMPKPWQPLNVLIATEQALAFRV